MKEEDEEVEDEEELFWADGVFWLGKGDYRE